MKRGLAICLWIMVVMMPSSFASAQDPISLIIKEGIKKVIKAVDLQIQRIQNETIWLQNAQKVVENKMSKLQLTQIGNWAQKQKALYSDYFDELWRAKALIAYHHQVKEIINKQLAIVQQYKQYSRLFKQDKNFTAEEIQYMAVFYSGVMAESLKSLDRMSLVINSFSTQMSDAGRMALIDNVADELDEHYNAIRTFNNQGAMLSYQRAKERGNAETVRMLYELR
ncbi:conjugal transfer protein TraI [Segetibacter sp. 3557_3]|uniref:conjugal transfer protein TraI n=1 Tax=Segetibacter sp. 3557_3 TaxID=2547429 RepID=UPI001058ABBC|nr:conjugal transfer protein TraI [Segetibacter sp. 3557_3]TDH18153.1 conjugal transfer protein TraI [Segetibacter sp. 3557_3]